MLKERTRGPQPVKSGEEPLFFNSLPDGNFETKQKLRSVIENEQTKEHAVSAELWFTKKKLSAVTEELEKTHETLNVLNGVHKQESESRKEEMLYHFKELVEPYLEKLKAYSLEPKQKLLVEALDLELKDIFSPLAKRLTSSYYNLTAAEIRVANLIKLGKTSQDIALLHGLSRRTIDSQRLSIRKKLGLKNRSTNLRTFLMRIR